MKNTRNSNIKWCQRKKPQINDHGIFEREDENKKSSMIMENRLKQMIDKRTHPIVP